MPLVGASGSEVEFERNISGRSGGGAMLIASSGTVRIDGSIFAFGGSQASNRNLRLMANQITGSGGLHEINILRMVIPPAIPPLWPKPFWNLFPLRKSECRKADRVRASMKDPPPHQGTILSISGNSRFTAGKPEEPISFDHLYHLDVASLTNTTTSVHYNVRRFPVK